MIFHSHASKIHFRKKGCALGLILKVRVFGTRKWPIRHFINEKRTGADRNASRNYFWDRCWERAGQLLANLFPVHSNSPRSLFENQFDPVSFSFLNWRIRHFHISHNTLCLRVSCSPTRANSFAYELFTFLSERLKAPKEDEDKAYAKLFARVGGQETRKQRVLWEMWKWRVIINRQRAVTRVVICVSCTCRSTD